MATHNGEKKRKSLPDLNEDQPTKKSKRDEATPNGDGDIDEVEAKRLRKEARKAEKKAAKLAAKSAPSGEADKPSDGRITETKDANDSEKRKEKKEKKAKSTAVENGTPSTQQSTSAGYTQDATLSALPQSEIDAFLSTNFITIEDTKHSNLRPIISFTHLPSITSTQSSHFKNFSKPTPIQSASWPFLLAGRDLVGVAETGSGKTLAFGVPCIAHISSSSNPRSSKGPAQAVIVSPTRELAVQIFDQIELIAKPAGLSTVCVYGGVPKDTQRAALKTAHIVVATPGRLNDLIDEGSAILSNVSYLVLDEADRMLDKGFEQEIRKIISACSDSKSRQTLMFTATWPQSIRDLAGTFMRQPVKISIGDNPTGELRANTRITQTVEVMDPHGKEQRLLQLLRKHQSGKNKDDKILVFCLYKKEASRIENFLYRSGLRVAGIHGDLSQEKRTASLESFKSGVTPLLVATDVAARGLDIPNVKMVINVTFPLTVEDYVHRIGRTGRAGASGQAITFFTEHDKALSGGLINVLKGAGQVVPEDLLKFGTTVKKKGHEAYGAFYKDVDSTKTATKVKFSD